MHRLKPLPGCPNLLSGSPAVVRVLDTIRGQLDLEKYAEFYWFAREYPRIYRYHLSNAEYRLMCIYKRYGEFHAQFSKDLDVEGPDVYQKKISNRSAYIIYWDFEAFLNAIGSALDVLAKILTTVHTHHDALTFKALADKEWPEKYTLILRQAERRWIKRLRDYRNCFVHETSVDTMLSCSCSRYSKEWQVRCKLPKNPNSRDILEFRWSRRYDVLGYIFSLWRHLKSLDKKIALQIQRDYEAGNYPIRVEHLFPSGRRMAQHTTQKKTKRRETTA